MADAAAHDRILTPREIIAEGWRITIAEKSIRRWGFFASFFEILLDVKLLIYQIYFLYEHFFAPHSSGDGLFDIEIMIYNALPFWLFLTIMILFVLLFIVELFIPSLSEGALIGLTAKAYKKEPVNGGFILALYNFFPMLALHEIFVFSSFTLMLTVCSMLLRYASDLNYPLMAFAFFIWLVSCFFKFFFNFAEEGVVIEKRSVFEAAGRSVKLIVSNVKHMVFLVILMLVISIRIILNALVILLLPAIIIGIGLLLTYFVQPVISYSIAAGIGVILIFVCSYFFAYLHVFKQAVWSITFIELSKQKELDKIG